MDIIKNQIEKIEEVVSDFKASDYFSLDYKETKKFSLTMLCALAGLYVAGLGTAKVIKLIKNQIEKIEGVVSDFKASDYFSLDYKETKKFSLTMLCALAGLYIAGLGTAKVIKLIKNELGKEDNK